MKPSQPCPKRLLDQVREVIRVKHYSYRTVRMHYLSAHYLSAHYLPAI
ncbi:MAG: hypothetical protein HC800_23740 [Phormidesmis sp. RL_2_1]|nr:hypothetical protein [Phormidesmis sp. RL_2_1]